MHINVCLHTYAEMMKALGYQRLISIDNTHTHTHTDTHCFNAILAPL
jgi:hypothetical protein